MSAAAGSCLIPGDRGGGVRAAVVGASGYTGRELVRILAGHPSACVAGLFASESTAEREVCAHDLFPELSGVCEAPVGLAEPDAIAAVEPDCVFLATPHELSARLAGRLRSRGLVVLDLSGGFRLRASDYPVWYGFEHPDPGLLDEAVYGLPELSRPGADCRRAIAGAVLVAVPGCYPTSVLVPLAPLVAAGAVEPGRAVIVDSVSGISGAGRKPSMRSSFCELSYQAYNVGRHRHQPEMELHSGLSDGGGVIFTPHVGPWDRGIVSTIHVDLAEGWTVGRVRELLTASYSAEPFVRLRAGENPPAAAWSLGTNFVDVAAVGPEEGRHAVLFGALDNLVKGASGQGVQCMNVRFGLDETAGLLGGDARSLAVAVSSEGASRSGGASL